MDGRSLTGRKPPPILALRMQQPTAAEARRGRSSQALGLAVLLALFLPLLWLRAGNPGTLWMDELHSLQLSQLTVERLLDESARDFHPPGYPLALKLWIKAGRVAGLDPGLPWARALNVVAWIAAVVASWLLGRHLLGRREGSLVAVAVAASAAASVVVADLRSYAWASCGLLVGALFLAALRGPVRSQIHAAALAAGCAGALTVALWSHLLAAPAAALLAATWGLVALGSRERRAAWRARVALPALLAPWLLALPWLLAVPGQLAHLRRAAPDWMTPASGANLLHVFGWWLPLGRIGAPSPAAEVVLGALGGLAVLVPLVLGRRRRRAAEPRRGAAARLALLTLPAAFGSVLLYWALARLDLAATFHGPRYPLLVWGLLAAGLAAAAIAGGRRLAHAVAAMAPWIVAGVVGQALAIQQEAAAPALAAFAHRLERLAPGSTLYVMPSELAPFVRETFAGFELRRIEDLACSPPPEALVLDVNPWPALDRPRDQVVARALRGGRLAADVARHDADPQGTAVAYRLRGVDPGFARELCDRGLRPAGGAPPGALSAGLPEDQLSGDGWSYLELDGQLDARRWATRSEVRIRFDRALPAGDYLLHLRGIRQPFPAEHAELSLELTGSSFRREATLGPGPFELTYPLTLDRAGRPTLRVRHPTWSPAEAMGTRDRRQLAFLLDAAWLSRPLAPAR
jgi:hypothetical protein